MTRMKPSGQGATADGLEWASTGDAATAPPAVSHAGPRRLATRFLILLLIALAPLTALEVWRGLDRRAHALNEAAEDGLALARSLAAQHRLLVEEVRRDLGRLSAAPVVRGGTADCSAALARTTARQEAVTGLALLSGNLSPVCATGTAVVADAAPGARAIAAAALKDGHFMAAPPQAVAPGVRPLQHVAQPVESAFPAERAVLTAEVDLLWFSPRLQELLKGANALILLVGAEDRIVASVPERAALAGWRLPGDALDAEAGPGEVMTGLLALDGRDMMLAAAGEEHGLRVAVAVDREAALGAADSTLARGAGWLVLTAAAGLLLAMLIARSVLFVPVARLAAAAGALSRGEPAPRLGPPYAGGAELAELARAFDGLSRRLASREAALISSETQLSARRQSEERYRALVELAPEAIVVEARGAVLYANSKAVELFGADGLEDLQARPLPERIHPDDRARVRERLGAAADHPAGAVMEVRMSRADGTPFQAEMVIGPVSFGGRPAHHVMVRDVTEERTASQRLRESEERFRTLVDASPDLILAHDHGRVVLANARAARALFGLDDPAAAVGRDVLDFVRPSDRPLAQQRMEAFYDVPRALDVAPMRIIRADGREILCDVYTAPVTFEGRLCIHTVLRDVTTRRIEQDSVAQSAKMATLGEMAAGMMHELAQPMNIILMAAEGGLMGLPAPGKEAAATAAGEAGTPPGTDADRRRLELIAAQAGRMGDIINHMRVFTRRDDGPEQRFAATDAARAAFTMMEHGLTSDGIAATMDLTSASTCVRGRRVQLEQVVLNLLTNARDAVCERRAMVDAPAGWTPRVTLSVTVQGGAVLIAVEDNGPGVAPDIRDRLFEPFVTTKEAGVGTGLGLSISDGLIRAMGGAITVETPAHAIGARFVARLPLDVDDGACGTPADDDSHASALSYAAMACDTLLDADDEEDDGVSALVGHVLIADDEAEAGALMGDFLSTQGYRVTIARNGEEAVRMFLRDPADVVVTDLRMPGGGGRGLIQRLRADVPDLPVVVVTGHVGDREAEALEAEDGVAAVLRKPVGLQTLVDLVDRLFHAQ